MLWNDANLIKVLEENGIVVMPTDTLYGIVGQAQNEATVNRIYNLKKRTSEKPCIILIGSMGELSKFSITLSDEQKKVLEENFKTPTSVILDCLDEKFSYLHRGTKTLAFRLPVQKEFQDFLLKTGPLVAPSANPEGLPPAGDIIEAKNYFGNSVDLYVDGGILAGKASKVIKLHKDGSVTILRA